MVEAVCADFGCLPSEAAAEFRLYEPTARLFSDVKDARMMRRIHEQHVASERKSAPACAADREWLAATYGTVYSRYLLPPEFVTE